MGCLAHGRRQLPEVAQSAGEPKSRLGKEITYVLRPWSAEKDRMRPSSGGLPKWPISEVFARLICTGFMAGTKAHQDVPAPQMHYNKWRTLMSPTPGSNLDKLIRDAIRYKRLIRLVYQDKERIVEPHDYGVHKGAIKLLAFQVRGSSSGRLPGWRWLEVGGISDAHLLAQTFPGNRPPPSGRHHQWDDIFIRVIRN